MTQDNPAAPPENPPAGAGALPAKAEGEVRPFDEARSALLNGDIEILSDRRLRPLDKEPVKAYEARPRGYSGRSPFFAMMCEDHLVPQSRAAAAYSLVINPGLARMLASGPVWWPPEKKFRYCFVYENTLGDPLARPGEQGLGWRQDLVMKAVIKPVIGTLLDLRDADVVHGNIRPSNMFDGGDKVIERVILGECLSTPPGYTQPVAFEPVERAMCDPIARGRGTFEDDLYSFGVSLTMILRKKDPLLGMTDEEIIREKIEMGSYAALTGKERQTGPILELLRGLLYDDRNQRWTLDEIMMWMDGQHLSPKQSARKKKASRPIQFNGERYARQALLAMDLNKNQSEAVQLVDGGGLEQWISRSLEDNSVKGRLAQAVETAQEQGRGPGYWDRLLSRVAVALDPEAPIRFKELRLHPEGIPYALAEAFVLKRDLQSFADVINQQIVTYWVSAQTDLRVDIGSLVSRFDSCRAFLRQANLGYGLDRCLYFLNPEAPCLSDRLRSHYVRTPEDLLTALEAVSGEPGRPELFIDRHIAAFLSVRDRKVIDPYWADLNAAEFHKRILGNLRVLATIQKRAKMDMFPGVSRWAADILDPVYERYHDRELRVKLKKKVEGIRDTGDITKIAAVFDDIELLQKDFASFRVAMAEYEELDKEAKALEAKLAKPEIFGRETGKEVAAIFSGFLAGIFILVLSFLFLSKKGIL